MQQKKDHPARLLEELLSDTRYAVRTLRKVPTLTVVCSLTLALGTGVTTAIFTVVNGVLLRSLAYLMPIV